MDLLIATTAYAHSASLYTRNPATFEVWKTLSTSSASDALAGMIAVDSVSSEHLSRGHHVVL
jgi:hypothetical protein